MAGDPFEYDFLFRPPIRGRARQGEGHGRGRSVASALARIRWSFDRSREAARGSQKTPYDVGRAPANTRRCVVKSHYLSVTGGGRLAAARHLNYIERDGVDRDGSPGRLYDARGTVERTAFAESLPGEKRQFRFIISPEDARQVDLRGFARNLVQDMERDLGRPLVWAAVNHHNTEHPHVHLVVRGVDGNGKEVRIPGRYIKQDMRARAQQLLTRELGLRTAADIARQRQREIELERLTSLDRHVENVVGPDGAIEATTMTGLGGKLRAAVLARLAVLARFGLAVRGRHGGWQLAIGWREDLVQLGLRDDIIKRLHRVAPGDQGRYRVLEPSQVTAPIEGVVRGRGLHDELTGELFAAVATTSGETLYVRLEPRVAEFLGDGDIVRISQATESWIKPTDKVLARIAERTGGIYDPSAHLRELEAGDGRAATPQELAAGNLRRLERLSKYGLVTRQQDGTWRISADLLQQLEARQASHPRHRLRVQYLGANLGIQSTYPGPTWLDRQVPAPLGGAPIGFAAELDSAIRARAAHLATLGLGEAGARDMKRLDAMERFLVGRRLARDLGVTFDDAGTSSRGVLVNCPPVPSGRAFARIIDARTKRLVLVPATVETERLEGREVEVTVDQNKQAIICQVRRRDRGEDR